MLLVPARITWKKQYQQLSTFLLHGKKKIPSGLWVQHCFFLKHKNNNRTWSFILNIPPASSILDLIAPIALFRASNPSVLSNVCVVTTYNGGAIKFIWNWHHLLSVYLNSIWTGLNSGRTHHKYSGANFEGRLPGF